MLMYTESGPRICDTKIQGNKETWRRVDGDGLYQCVVLDAASL